MPRWLEGKSAVVTGSGRGIGRATADLLAAEGAPVLVTDLEPSTVAETVSAIKAAGGTAHGWAGDVTSPSYPAQLVHTILDAFGRLDILVNNAGYT